jgi:hypothetical protein
VALVTGGAASQGGARATSVQAKRSAILAYMRDLQKQKQSLVGVQLNEYEVYLDCTSADRLVDYVTNTPADPLTSAACARQRSKVIEKNLSLLGRREPELSR